MRRAEGNAGVRLLECTSPARDKWRVRWDVQDNGDGTASWMEEEFGHLPDGAEIRSVIVKWYNDRTDESILSGFEYEGHAVWLSVENQFNYKAAYDLAVQTGGANLPVTFKLGTDDEPYYRTFDTVESLQEFYVNAMRHIQDVLEEGWRKKDAVNLESYRV